MSSYDDEINIRIRKYIEEGSISRYVSIDDIGGRLYTEFPFKGSKIEWSSLPVYIERCDYNQNSQIASFSSFFREIKAEFELFGTALYFGDDRTDVILRGSMDKFSEVLDILLEVPQHNYFIDIDFRWCMCFSFEGDMGFGSRS